MWATEGRTLRDPRDAATRTVQESPLRRPAITYSDDDSREGLLPYRPCRQSYYGGCAGGPLRAWPAALRGRFDPRAAGEPQLGSRGLPASRCPPDPDAHDAPRDRK